MFKKIVLGALMVGLIGVLIAGAVIRTNAKAADGAGGEAERRGRATEYVAAEDGSGGQRGGRWALGNEGELGSSRGGVGQTAGEPGAVDAVPAPQAGVTPEEWVTLSGTVISVADDLVEIKTTTGETIPLEGRPLSFAAEQGLVLEMGEAVTLSGFAEDGEFKIGQLTNSTTGVVLRDVSGRPGWAGRGGGR